MPKRVRPIRIEGDVAYVPLTKGYEAVIDAADVSLVEGRNWSAGERKRSDGEVRCIYAQSHQKNSRGQFITAYLHRVILRDAGLLQVDHIDGNGLNNRRSNLRAATKAQNQMNSRVRCNNKAGIKGVCYSKKRDQWEAYIHVGGKKEHLGFFDDPESAALAYAEASHRLHGEFGRTE